MQISLMFTCRECGEENLVWTDTSNMPEEKSLACVCGHVSGDLHLAYFFGEQHQPSWEKDAEGERL